MKRYKKRAIFHALQTLALAICSIGCVFLFSSGGWDAIISCGLFGIFAYHSGKRLMPSVLREEREEEEYRDRRLQELTKIMEDEIAALNTPIPVTIEEEEKDLAG